MATSSTDPGPAVTASSTVSPNPDPRARLGAGSSDGPDAARELPNGHPDDDDTGMPSPLSWAASLTSYQRTHLWAAALAAGGGLVHALAGEGHFSEWWGYGTFFLAVSICQLLGGAALLFWNDRKLYWTGIAGTCVVLVIWTLSRTVGIQIGPAGAGPEQIGLLDTISNAFELGLVWMLIRLLRDPSPDAAPLEGALADERGTA